MKEKGRSVQLNIWSWIQYIDWQIIQEQITCTSQPHWPMTSMRCIVCKVTSNFFYTLMVWTFGVHSWICALDMLYKWFTKSMIKVSISNFFFWYLVKQTPHERLIFEAKHVSCHCKCSYLYYGFLLLFIFVTLWGFLHCLVCFRFHCNLWDSSHKFIRWLRWSSGRTIFSFILPQINKWRVQSGNLP